MDFFNEHIVKAYKKPLDYLIILGSLVIAYLLISIILAFEGFIPSLMLLEIAAVLYGDYWVITSTSVEFEYSLTNDLFDVDKIIAKKRRKRVISINARNIEYLAPVSDKYADVFNDKSIVKRIDASCRRLTPRHCFAIFYHNGEKTCLVFEPTDKMLEKFKTTVPKSLNFTTEG